MFENLINTTNTNDKNIKLEHITKLLALYIARYQLGKNAAPLSSVAEFINDDLINTEHKNLLTASNKVISASLSVLEKEFKKKDLANETRTQPRKHVNMSVIVNRQDITKKQIAKVLDVSWGGIQISCPQNIANIKSSLSISLPYRENDFIDIEGQIVRAWGEKDAFNYAIRFTLLEYKDEKKYTSFLESLYQDSDNDKHVSHTRFAHVLDLTYADVDDLLDVLSKVKDGAIEVIYPDPIEKNKSVLVEFEYPEQNYYISLRARVHKSEVLDIGSINMYKTHLVFEHPKQDLINVIEASLTSIKNGLGNAYKSPWS